MPLGDYLAFLASHRLLNFIGTFSMYLVHGLCLAVLTLALHERLKSAAPRLSLVAASIGLIWTSFVLLSGFLNLVGTESLFGLYEKSPAQAEALRTCLSAITLGIDSSDKLLGNLWVGLASLAALRTKTFPKVASLLGLAV